MNLPRGTENTQNRIEMRAEAILRGLDWGTQPDDSDINSNEAAEIDAAKTLAEEWSR